MQEIGEEVNIPFCIGGGSTKPSAIVLLKAVAAGLPGLISYIPAF